jgi:antitoxin CptB
MNKEVIRKKLLIRSWRRGTKELDLILGQFANQNLNNFELSQLALYEEFLSNDDYLIYDWIFQKAGSPKDFHILIKSIRQSIAL